MDVGLLVGMLPQPFPDVRDVNQWKAQWTLLLLLHGLCLSSGFCPVFFFSSSLLWGRSYRLQKQFTLLQISEETLGWKPDACLRHWDRCGHVQQCWSQHDWRLFVVPWHVNTSILVLQGKSVEQIINKHNLQGLIHRTFKTTTKKHKMNTETQNTL